MAKDTQAPRSLARALLLLLLSSAALPLSAQAKAGDSAANSAEEWKAAAIPLEESILPDPPAGAGRTVMRNVSIGGTAFGFVIAGWGIAMVFQGAANGPDREGVHRGTALAVSGSLVASLFASATFFYSRPPGPSPAR